MPLQRDSCPGCLDWLLIVLGIFPRFGQVITLSRCCALLLLLFCRPARYHPSTTHHRHSQIGSLCLQPPNFWRETAILRSGNLSQPNVLAQLFFFLFWTAQKAKPPPAARPTRRLAAQPPLSSFTWCRCRCCRCCCCCCLMLLLFA